jgi:DNA-binding transcriptional LysR family regulator
VGLGKRDGLVRLLPDELDFPLETWIVMHEDQRSNARMRVVFDHLVEAMSAYARER